MNRQMQQSLFSCKFNIGKGYYFFLSRQHNTNVYAIEHFQLKRRENFLTHDAVNCIVVAVNGIASNRDAPNVCHTSADVMRKAYVHVKH